MLLFGHLGLTVGAGWLLGSLPDYGFKRLVIPAPADDPTRNPPPEDKDAFHKPNPGAEGLRGIDLRLVMLGSMLPDIVDKPMGVLIFIDTFSSGRVLGHTLLFTLFLVILGLLRNRRGKPALLVLGLSSLAHLFFDEMWLYPQTLLWPAYGWVFEKEILASWVPKMIQALQSEPDVFVPEILGFAVMVTLVRTLLERKRLVAFLKSGLT